MLWQKSFVSIPLLIERWFSPRHLFLFGAVGLGVVLTWLGLIHFLPFSLGYFIFYTILLFLAALARPNWMFLLFLALLPIEIVSVMPEGIGFSLRPYQWVGGILGVAVAFRLLTRSFRFVFHWTIYDTLLLVFLGGTALSGLLSGGQALKQTVVIGSFLFLYFLSRIFLRSWNEVKPALLFFGASATGVLLWSVVQNILFLGDMNSWAVMPGRPNGTLLEPDWLGLFLLFLLAPTLLVLKERLGDAASFWLIFWPWLGLVGIFVVLLLSVSRSAWLGALGLTCFFTAFAFWERRSLDFRSVLTFGRYGAIAFGLALLLVEAVPLTRFELLNRAESTASQLQEITIACDGVAVPPKQIERVEDLAQYDCEHILLEEKETRRAAGALVTTTMRPDPNVNIRKQIYQTSWKAIQEHPVLGIGWGNIGPKLGVDERGASYNASNLWLEVWLGGGLIALLALLTFVGFALLSCFLAWRRGDESLRALTLAALLLGFLLFNFFNTGLLLGFVWVWLALFPLIPAPHFRTAPK